MASTQDEDSRPGILTSCAACAIRIPHTAPRCGRCHTRYCGSACQTAHWGQGHKELCKKIKRGGFAEQYHADKMYKAAVAEAVAAAAKDAVGQTCYICKEGPGKEGLAASGCACRGTAGFVHISCRARQAQVLVEEGLENNLPMDSRWAVWDHCPLCHQYIVGPMRHALGWACWRSYVRKPDGQLRARAMEGLGYSLGEVNRNEMGAAVLEATIDLTQRLGEERNEIIEGLANCYARLGRDEVAHRLRTKSYEDSKASDGEAHPQTLRRACNLGEGLSGAERKPWFRKQVKIAQTALGEDDPLTLALRANLALSIRAMTEDTPSSASGDHVRRVLISCRTDCEEAAAILTDVNHRARRLLGGQHPKTIMYAEFLKTTQEALAHVNTDLALPLASCRI